MDKKDVLKNTDSIISRVIFSHAVDATDQTDRRMGMVRFSTTWFFNLVFLRKPGLLNCLNGFRSFLETYVGKVCSLLGLHTFTDRRFTLLATSGPFFLTCDNCPA